MNKSLKIESHVFQAAAKVRAKQGLTMDDCYFIYAEDCNGFNSGSVFIRNSAWTREVILRTIASRGGIDIYGKPIPKYHHFDEQASLGHILQNMHEFTGNRATKVDQRIINAVSSII